MDDSCHSTGAAAEEKARQAIIHKIDSHEALKEKAIRGFGNDWKEAPLFKLRGFLTTPQIEE